jgi:hypothetical protein
MVDTTAMETDRARDLDAGAIPIVERRMTVIGTGTIGIDMMTIGVGGITRIRGRTDGTTGDV